MILELMFLSKQDSVCLVEKQQATMLLSVRMMGEARPAVGRFDQRAGRYILEQNVCASQDHEVLPWLSTSCVSR